MSAHPTAAALFTSTTNSIHFGWLVGCLVVWQAYWLATLFIILNCILHEIPFALWFQVPFMIVIINDLILPLWIYGCGMNIWSPPRFISTSYSLPYRFSSNFMFYTKCWPNIIRLNGTHTHKSASMRSSFIE